MRIKRLELKAYGPFTDRILEFDSEDPGLHIIFGPNEAGKSSALRALKALLYGFPQQTPDNFLHSYDQLLVGGCLELRDGKELYFQRRKKRTADIIDERGDPLDHAVVAPFIHNVEPEIFETLYGIDHQTLVQGGKDILDQKGEIGQALFAAGAGISSLRSIIEQLEQEAAELFKPSGQNPKINKAIRNYKELQRELREASLSSKDWQDLQKALKNAETAREALIKERDRKSKESRRLERLSQAIPELAALKLLRNQIVDLGQVTPLPADFNDRHRQVTQEIRELKLQLENDSGRLKDLEEKRNALSFNRELIDQAERVDDFHQRLGEYRKGQKDRPERDGMRMSLTREAASLLKQIRPDLPLEEIETLRPMLNKKRTIQTLSNQYEGLKQRQLQAEKQLNTAREELLTIEERLGDITKPTPNDGLLKAVKLAQKAGAIDVQLAKSKGAIEQGKRECLKELKRLGLWSGDLSALIELPLPLAETVQQFEVDYSGLADEKRGLEKDRKNDEKELKGILSEMKKLEYGGEVPSEENLAEFRAKRNQGWQLIRRNWLDQEDVTRESRSYEPEIPLPEAFEGHMENADRIADRLRREADRVANSAALRAKAESLRDALEEYDKNNEILNQREQKLRKEWAEVWKPAEITPLTPKEMRGWLVGMEKLRYKVGEVLKNEEEDERLFEHRNDLRKKVRKELEAIGEKEIPKDENLGPLLVTAETILERIADQKTKFDRLMEARKKEKNKLEEAEENLKGTKDTLTAWQKDWKKAFSGMGLKEDPATLEAMDLIDTLQNCFDKLKEANDFQKRIEGIDRDAAELKEDVDDLLKKVAPEMASLPLDQAILQVRILLQKSQKEGTIFDSLSEDIEQLKEAISTLKKTLQSTEEQLEELLKIARCERPEELAEVISRFTEYQGLREKIKNIEETITRIGAGTTIAELSQQAAEVDADELPGRIETLQQDIEEKINPEIEKVSELRGQIIEKLAAMDGSARAAEAAEKIEQELAAIRRYAERYARVKLASKVLQLEIERYRSEHQDPVLKIASGYFSEMTLQSFAGLRADVDDKGEPILVGVRPDEKRLGVEGMSDGTSDQLYLALRLATLEKRLESSEPMPFIVDDILVNFDDERSRTTLKALADLAGKNQVILFTHHQQIVDDAKKIEAKGSVSVHELT